jgi:xylulokinase
MANQYLITIDVGTSSTKTALWTEKGEAVVEVSSSYSLDRPRPLWVEIDPTLWWQAISETLQQVLERSGVDSIDIVGVGIDAIGWTLIPVDKNINPLTPAMIWQDRRAEAETAWLNALPDAQDLINLSANPIDAAYLTPKLLWLKKNRPKIFDATHRFLEATGYIVAMFTNEYTCDYTQAYGYHFFDIRKEEWDQEKATKLGVPLEKMPRLCPSSEVVGEITEKAAQETGLRQGTPVIAGCLDAAAGALGAAVIHPGQTNEQGGQAGGFGISLDHVVVEPRLIFCHHLIPNQYLLQAGTVGGGSLEWFRANIDHDKQTSFDQYSQEVASTSLGANGLIFLPYMAGERTPFWSSTPKGVFFGLSYQTERADMLRAIMEGCAFAVYDNVEIARENGVQIDEYLGSGGATQSTVWCQIKADIYGKPFIVSKRADGGDGGHGLGLFALTAYGVGLRDDIGEVIVESLPKKKIFEPSTEKHVQYEELFQIYRNLSRKLMQDFEDLQTLSEKYTVQ